MSLLNSNQVKWVLGVVVVTLAAAAWLGLDDDAASSARESVLSRQVTPAKELPEGFVVWSSNRSGSHSIFRMTLPDMQITQLTDHPNVDYHPRISPDGARIVFARSREPGLSTRNQHDWNVIILDLDTGREQLLHEFGNFPTWSADGKRVYFQFKVAQLGEFNIETGEARIAFPRGRGQVKPGTGLQTPHMSPDGDRMAVTLRFEQNMTAIVDMKGRIRKIANGCQLTWSPEGNFLYFVDYGGRMKNAVYVYEPSTGKPQKWFDMPGGFSHEYFPKLSADERWLVFGASRSEKAHEHDQADFENFIWQVGTPIETATRLTFDEGNDNYPDIYLYE